MIVPKKKGISNFKYINKNGKKAGKVISFTSYQNNSGRIKNLLKNVLFVLRIFNKIRQTIKDNKLNFININCENNSMIFLITKREIFLIKNTRPFRYFFLLKIIFKVYSKFLLQVR